VFGDAEGPFTTIPFFYRLFFFFSCPAPFLNCCFIHFRVVSIFHPLLFSFLAFSSVGLFLVPCAVS